MGWKRWKRAFDLYVASKGVINDKQKVALLLHSGEMELQEVFYTLVPEDQETSFTACLAALDNYFTPKVRLFAASAREPYHVTLLIKMRQFEIKSSKNAEIPNFVGNFSRKRVV